MIVFAQIQHYICQKYKYDDRYQFPRKPKVVINTMFYVLMFTSLHQPTANESIKS